MLTGTSYTKTPESEHAPKLKEPMQNMSEEEDKVVPGIYHTNASMKLLR